MARVGRRLVDPPADPVDMSAIRGMEEDDDFDASEPEEDGYEEDASTLNDPDVTTLGAGPRIGGGGSRFRRSDVFDNAGDLAPGRATSPRLYAQAAQFPTCVQLRVWKWENGVPVSLGVIDAEATEEDFVRQFFTAMPRRGETRAQFRLRPIDIRGQELGQEVTNVISEHHAAIRALREAEEEEREARMYGRNPRNRYGDDNGGTPQVIVEAPHGGSDGTEQMGHVMDRMIEVVEARAKALEEALEMERERVREEEGRRAQERIDLATNAAQGVQALTERAMKDEAQRAERAMRSQQEQANLMVTTLTANFQQQQAMQAQMAEERRRQDEYRLEQERQRAERERKEVEDRLRREREEAESKRLREREEAELRLREAREEAKARFEQQKMELEMRLAREREELERKERREKEEREARERWFAEERARREEREGRERIEREESRERRERIEREERERREVLIKEELREREAERQRQHELRVKEMEAAASRDREHAERMASMARLELEAKSHGAGADPLANTMKLFSQFGIPPEEVFPRMFGMKGAAGEDEEGKEKEAGWMAALPMALGALGEVAKAMSTRGPAAPPQGARPPQGPPPQYAPQRPPQAYIPGPQSVPQPQRALPQPPPQAQPASAAPREPVMVEAASAPVPAVAAPAPVAVTSTSDLAQKKGLNLRAMKSARLGLRALVKRIAATDEDKWEELIGSAIFSEINILHYARAVTVKRAMQEGGADDALVTLVIAAMRASSIVPEDMEYGDDNAAPTPTETEENAE